jgi:hypothetical protein
LSRRLTDFSGNTEIQTLRMIAGLQVPNSPVNGLQ